MPENLKTYDLLIIGGGINGTGIAADAAGRGLSVVLCEKNDFGSATSSASSKLIHGGLRYLENLNIKLVRESLKEREILLHKAAHLIQPLRFIMPDNKAVRSAWLLKLGLLAYQYLAGKTSLPKIRRINFKRSGEKHPLKKTIKKGFSYYDCQVDDARLVILNARQAAEFGATLLTRHQFIHAKRFANYWQVTLKDSHGNSKQYLAKILVNATGPWVKETLQHLQAKTHLELSLVKGSHIVLPQLYEGRQAYILQNKDKRVVFVIPFAQHFTLVGTTEIPYLDCLDQVRIDKAEIDYLCDCVSDYFDQPISPQQVCSSFAGVRPLIHNPHKPFSAVSREYAIEWDQAKNLAPLLSIFGGKITTYRSLAEKAVNALQAYFPDCAPTWTANTYLPGGDLPTVDIETYVKQMQSHYAWLPEQLVRRYCYAYGNLINELLVGAKSIHDLGRNVTGDLYQREVEYLIEHEWVQTAEDLLWRRSKLGLVFNADQVAQLQRFLNHYF